MEFKLKPFFELIPEAHITPYGMLYLQGDWPWTANTLGIIYEGERGVNLEDIDPEFVEKNFLTRVIGSDALEDVILNAHLQKPYVTLSEIVAAFNHYFKYDGFMTLE
jgi:hypothetical protein